MIKGSSRDEGETLDGDLQAITRVSRRDGHRPCRVKTPNFILRFDPQSDEDVSFKSETSFTALSPSPSLTPPPPPAKTAKPLQPTPD